MVPKGINQQKYVIQQLYRMITTNISFLMEDIRKHYFKGKKSHNEFTGNYFKVKQLLKQVKNEIKLNVIKFKYFKMHRKKKFIKF